MVLQNQSLPTLQQVIDGVIVGVCLLKSLDVCLCGNWFGQSRLLGSLFPSEVWSQPSQAPGEAWGKLFQVSIILGPGWFRISLNMGVFRSFWVSDQRDLYTLTCGSTHGVPVPLWKHRQQTST